MRKLICALELSVFLILASGITPTIAADDIPYPCQTPTERATRVINGFLRGADNYIESEAQNHLAASRAEAMTEARNRNECEKLLQEAHSKITYKRDRGPAEGAYFWDVSFFKVGDYYAVVMIERPNTDKDPSELTPLDKAWSGQQAMVELYDSRFERLGTYSPSGSSRRYDNRVVLSKDDMELLD